MIIFFCREIRLSSSFLPLSLKDCSILIRWTTPTGIYVDPYELQSSIMNETIHFSNPVNIEQMAHRAESLVLYSFPKLDCSTTSCQFSMSIPVHLRYHLPSTTATFTKLSLPSPVSYFSCDCPTLTIDAAVRRCVWTQLPEPKVVVHDIFVPVGDLSHSLLVTLVTIALTFSGTGYVAWIVLVK